jgi:hypothetical protein
VLQEIEVLGLDQLAERNNFTHLGLPPPGNLSSGLVDLHKKG